VGARTSRLLAGRRGGAAFGVYLLLAFLFLGLRVAEHPERRVVGGLFTDPQIFIWSFAWWPHAILHGQNPFYTHAIWAPGGYNLTWATSVPGLAIVFAPLTLAFGPILAYNVASILMPALTAWTAFLLCRRVTNGALWPSLAGGYLFGFSAYVMSASLTHIHTAAVFLLPVAAHLVVRFVQGDLTGRRFAISMGAVLAGQMLISTEILFTGTVALVAALLLAALFVRRARRPLRRMIAPLAAAFALAAVVTAPFLWFVLTGTASRPAGGAWTFSSDLANLVVPTMASVGGWWVKHWEAAFPANDAERGTYLGVPVLLIVVLFAWRRRALGTTWFLVTGFLLAILLSLGAHVTVHGRRLATLPYSRLTRTPLGDNLMPARLMAYAALAASVMVALWAASSFGAPWLRAGLTGLAVLALVPNLAWGAWARTPEVPSLFTTSLVRSCIGSRENVLLLPFGTLSDSEIWQVRAGFRFDVAGGYISPFPPAPYGKSIVGIYKIASEASPPDVTANDVLALVNREHVSSIVLANDSLAWRWKPTLRHFARPQAVGGALIYRLRDAPPLRAACARAAAAG
jgi:hypothetical protein